MSVSSHKGIGYNKYTSRWTARTSINGKRITIGNFKTEQEAITGYNKFIEENKDNLSDKVKNQQKRKSPRTFEKDQDGLIIKTCLQCGKISKLKARITSDLCMSCSFKNTYKNGRTPNLYKELENIQDVINDYESGMSLAEVGEKYGFSADVIQAKMIKSGYKTRTTGESRSLVMNKFYSNPENRKRVSAKKQGIPLEEWTKFIKPETQRMYNSAEYNEWRLKVYRRDRFICQLCNQTSRKLEAHHIKKKKLFPELAFDVSNGITLCETCHREKINNHESEFEQFFQNIVNNLNN